MLFQGDSVTDAGRSRDDDTFLGYGYPMFIASWFNALYPEYKVKFLNRGVSGDRVKNLKERWQCDCIDLKPDIVSILIGINDTWRRYDSNDPTSADEYFDNYKYILNQVRVKLDAKMIVCEPFLLSASEDKKNWREDLDPKIQVARELAREFDALYIPFDGIFARASALREPKFWAADGVHPTAVGHALMAQEWLKAVKAI